MDRPAAPLGVAASPDAPKPEGPWSWSPPSELPELRTPLLPSSPTWPRSAQVVTALLLLLALGLLSWQVYSRQPWAGKPTVLVRSAPLEPFDLNRASTVELMQLPGVGERTAQRIEAYRQEHGPFRSVAELQQVPGIGPALVERLRSLLYVEGASPPILARGQAPDLPQQALPPVPRWGGKKEAPATRIDVNRADAAELQRLPGIGKILSQRIIAARQEAPFRSAEDLRRVRGIGAKTVDKIRPYIVFGEGQP
jgi:competence protein ComEA